MLCATGPLIHSYDLEQSGLRMRSIGDVVCCYFISIVIPCLLCSCDIWDCWY